MAQVLTIIAPIFIVVFIGFCATKCKLLDAAGLAGLGRFVLFIALPALIIINVGNSDFQQVFEPWFFLAYGLGSLLTYGLVFLYSSRWQGQDTVGAGIRAMGSSFSNSGFIGFPLLLQVFDSPPLAAFAIILVFENTLLMPLALTVLEYGNRDKNTHLLNTIGQLLARLGKNPIIIAIAVGVLLSVLQLPIPAALNNSLQLLSNASAGVALFFIGASLGTHKVSGRLADISLVAILKLTLHPAMVALMLLILPAVDPQMAKAAILFAAVPMLSIYAIIGARFNYGAFCSSTITLSTVLSFITIAILLLLIQ
ncbi:AEC family transporter [Halioxenophilus aromaticivorans]|uniref:AEC family transporter n=1 Tax=Halioxenophilus aromaticivorans TaxID=1306992 RepID=A0AAV3U5S9_9ALTE